MASFGCYDNSDVIATRIITNFHQLYSETCIKLDCKTVGFFLKTRKEIGKAWRKSLTRAKRASLTPPSLPSLALCFQPRSRPFV